MKSIQNAVELVARPAVAELVFKVEGVAGLVEGAEAAGADALGFLLWPAAERFTAPRPKRARRMAAFKMLQIGFFLRSLLSTSKAVKTVTFTSLFETRRQKHKVGKLHQNKLVRI